VNYPAQPNIASSIIAVTCICIRRSRERSMTEAGEREPEPPEEGNRAIENAVLLGFFALLVAAGIWLLGTMADVRRVQDCAAQGRRNCATIDVPARTR
jgi:heme/copper-type cytochrome/quinol oxidase subunit 2